MGMLLQFALEFLFELLGDLVQQLKNQLEACLFGSPVDASSAVVHICGFHGRP
jgi:hypothetical protein